MGLFKRSGASRSDLDLIAGFGRHQFLGWEAAGEASVLATNWWNESEPWRAQLLAGPPASTRTIKTLNDLAEKHGGWVAIGAWKLVFEFAPSVDDAVTQGGPALRACVRAYDAFGITNLAIHLPPAEANAYHEVFGRPAPHDGFFGPPVFSTPDGPQKTYYLDGASRAAAARHPLRLTNVPGVEPAALAELGTTGLWDFARLVIQGPLLVPDDLRDERAILAAMLAAASGVDHARVLAGLRDGVAADSDPMWSAVGAARFCEEYLDPGLTGSPDHLTLLDAGLRFLQPLLGAGNLARGALSPAEAGRLPMLFSS